jgi:hypothetical protein
MKIRKWIQKQWVPIALAILFGFMILPNLLNNQLGVPQGSGYKEPGVGTSTISSTGYKSSTSSSTTTYWKNPSGAWVSSWTKTPGTNGSGTYNYAPTTINGYPSTNSGYTRYSDTKGYYTFEGWPSGWKPSSTDTSAPLSPINVEKSVEYTTIPFAPSVTTTGTIETPAPMTNLVITKVSNPEEIPTLELKVAVLNNTKPNATLCQGCTEYPHYNWWGDWVPNDNPYLQGISQENIKKYVTKEIKTDEMHYGELVWSACQTIGCFTTFDRIQSNIYRLGRDISKDATVTHHFTNDIPLKRSLFTIPIFKLTYSNGNILHFVTRSYNAIDEEMDWIANRLGNDYSVYIIKINLFALIFWVLLIYWIWRRWIK